MVLNHAIKKLLKQNFPLFEIYMWGINVHRTLMFSHFLVFLYNFRKQIMFICIFKNKNYPPNQ